MFLVSLLNLSTDLPTTPDQINRVGVLCSLQLLLEKFLKYLVNILFQLLRVLLNGVVTWLVRQLTITVHQIDCLLEQGFILDCSRDAEGVRGMETDSNVMLRTFLSGGILSRFESGNLDLLLVCMWCKFL